MSFPAPPPVGLETLGQVNELHVPDVLAPAPVGAQPLRVATPVPVGEGARAPLAGSALLGLAAGHRSMAPLAVLAFAPPRRGLAIPVLAATLALTELVVDKLRVVPRRTRAMPALVRALSGITAGALGARRARRSRIMGAVIGGAAAIAATELGLRLRLVAEDSMPPILAGLVEDTLAVSMAIAGASLVGGRAERVRHDVSHGRGTIRVRVNG